MRNGDYLTESNRRFEDFCRCRGFDSHYALLRLIDFWETSHHICIFCQSPIVDGVCIKCGRSDDFEYELMVKEEQKKRHENWQFYSKVSGMQLRVMKR
jgi:hypothetical protein